MDAQNQSLIKFAAPAILAAGAAASYLYMSSPSKPAEATPAAPTKKDFKINWTNLRELADKYEIFLFDCDGVLWHGDKLMIGEAFRNIEWLESKGKKVFFVTNNASKSRKSMVKKM